MSNTPHNPQYSTASSPPTNSIKAQQFPAMNSNNNNTVPGDHRIRIKNRRKRYLDLHPEYFRNPDLELADPLLYDRLIRRFQTVSEREIETRAKGYSRTLEADLLRSEAKLAAIRDPDPASPTTYRQTGDGSILEEGDEGGSDGRREGLSKEGAWERWVDVMSQRFLRGEDPDFDYGSEVDGSEEYDDFIEEERVALEKYLDGEEEGFVGDGSPKGETGVQDF